jgi:hypothetical protein
LRAVTLLLLLAISLFGADITDIVYPDREDKNGAFKLTLRLKGDFNGSFEQKNEGSAVILIFHGLNSAKSFTKTLNTSIIQNVNIKPLNKDSTQISFVGKQLFDLSVAHDANVLYITLVPKATPFTIEDIAKDTGGGTIVGYVLDTLFYIAAFLFVLTIVIILFLKSKLFPRIKKANAIERFKQPEVSHESAFKNTQPEISAAILPKEPKIKPKKKSSAAKQKTLFD